MALSHATHKVISLPMFRKDVGVSGVVASLLFSLLLALMVLLLL